MLLGKNPNNYLAEPIALNLRFFNIFLQKTEKVLILLSGVIVNYRIPYTKEAIIRIPEITDKKQAAKLIGKKTMWKNSKGVKHYGKVTGLYGSSGAIKAKFRIPLPPESLAKIVEVYD